jgi:hypothetical protein
MVYLMTSRLECGDVPEPAVVTAGGDCFGGGVFTLA